MSHHAQFYNVFLIKMYNLQSNQGFRSNMYFIKIRYKNKQVKQNP
jgi:hypothetical protein